MMNGASSLLVCRTRAWTLLPSVTSARRQYNLQYITTSFHHHQQQQQHHPTTNHARNHILVRLRSSWTNDNDSNNNNDWTDEPRPRTTNNRGGRSDRSSRGNDNNYNRDQSPQRQTSSWDREDDWRRDNNEYRSSRSSRGGRGGDRGGGRGGRGRGGRGGRGGRRDTNRGSNNDQQWRRDGPREGNRFGGRPEDNAPKIDMKGLEAEGFVHLYGLAPVLSALKANRRDFSPQDQPQATTATSSGSDYFDDDDDDGNNENNNNDDDFNAFPSEYIPRVSQSTIKPEAQFTPWLFLQDRSGGGSSGRSGDKVEAATQVNQLAEERGIPVHYTDKGSLNALSGNRPHQGFVLRCGVLDFEPIVRIPFPDASDPSSPNLWLVLDEVVDPQNLGALLRSSYFLGGSSKQRMGILVCSKNSAPPSPVVSASSAGALELLQVFSTSSLPRTLASAREDGFRIIGAAASKPKGMMEDESVGLYDLQNLPNEDQPTMLVLGSEGHGLRTLVAKLCTDFVRIPRGDEAVVGDDGNDDIAVDSLNVSVTGGILLWHLLYGGQKVN